MSMAKLDQHANMIKKVYAETKTIKGTRDKLIEKGVRVSYETLRQWLKNHKDDLPNLRAGAGRPKSQKTAQLFKFLDSNANWMPDAGIHPQFFLIFHPNNAPENKDWELTAYLLRFGIEVKELDITVLPLKRFRCLSDLELYVIAYLLGRHGPLFGISEDEFESRIRAITPMAFELKNIIHFRNSITVGELRELLFEAETNCRAKVEQSLNQKRADRKN